MSGFRLLIYNGKEKTVSTQRTLDKQTATFVAALAQNIPALSGGWAQFLMENPEELKSRLAHLQPTLRYFMGRTKMSCIELIELDPQWDFLIMRSTTYPEVGVAVSNRSGSLGRGLRLALLWEKGYEQFTAPCGCCNWSGSRDEEKAARRQLREVCAANGITILLFHCWSNAMEQDVDGLRLLDPYGDQLEQIDKERFLRGFDRMWHMDVKGSMLSIGTLFEKKK